MKNPAVIVGNGLSRKGFDLEKLVGRCPIYGCNALYRDFSGWDYLVAIDDNMIQEILSKKYPIEKQLIIPEESDRYEKPEYSFPFGQRRTNSGMIAMEKALDRGHDLLFCLGFDFLLSGDQSVSNVYEGSQNYGSETKATETDNVFRIKYLEWFVARYPESNFIFVFPEQISNENVTAENILSISYQQFEESF